MAATLLESIAVFGALSLCISLVDLRQDPHRTAKREQATWS